MALTRFTSNDIRFTKGIVVVDFLVIGGGAGGRNTTAVGTAAGGGGAGAYLTSIAGESSGGGESNLQPLRLSANTPYTVTIGAGGAVSGNASSTTLARVRASNGTTGDNPGNRTGLNGGGGADSANNNRGPGSTGSVGYMYPGGASFPSATSTLRAGGGGGGAGAAGSNGASGVGGNGGAGLASTITGTSVTRAGGGGGTATDTNTQGTGGSGGGGNAAFNGTAGNGTANTGSGGGAQTGSGTAGTGGSGIVIIKYPEQWNLTVGTGLTSSTTTSSGYKITSFTAGTDTITFS